VFRTGNTAPYYLSYKFYIRNVGKRKPKKKRFDASTFIMICIALLFIVVKNYNEYNGIVNPTKQDSFEKISGGIYRSLTWRDYSRASYELDYSITDKSVRASSIHKNRINTRGSGITSNETYWAVVYQKVLNHDKEVIRMLADSMLKIQKSRKLNTRQFADVITTFVQDIEYSFVFQDRSCEEEPNRLCVTGRKFGLHTPTEFLHTLQGDCDTRALLLFGVFKYLGYDPKIVVSKAYLHAMLMLDLPSKGPFLKQNGKKYYFWETTYRGWKLGDLPPTNSDLTKWKIVL